MKRNTWVMTMLTLLMGVFLLPAHAWVTFDLIGEGYGTDVSGDGTVVVGQTPIGETFYWSDATGLVTLGRNVVGLGRGGKPSVNYDGTRISASIMSVDSTYVTAGIWTKGYGWDECMPPPPDGGALDGQYSSAWNISDDGDHVVGLFWRAGAPFGTGTAHGLHWSTAAGCVSLGSSGGDSRANGCSADGSVIAGWSADPVWGGWQPCVWVDGALTILGTYDAQIIANGVNAGGTVVVGQSYIAATDMRVAARWDWNGSTWVHNELGALPGTSPGMYGQAVANGVTSDGNTIVGYNQFSGPWSATGFIWTLAEGLMDVEDFLAANGVTPPAGFDIRTLSAVSNDGRVMVGTGQDTVSPFSSRAFVICQGIDTAAEGAPAPFRIVGNHPNPFNPSTVISFEMNEALPVRLDVYSPSGQKVRTLLGGETRDAGVHQIVWDGRDDAGRTVPAGVYISKLEAAGRSESGRMVLIK